MADPRRKPSGGGEQAGLLRPRIPSIGATHQTGRQPSLGNSNPYIEMRGFKYDVFVSLEHPSSSPLAYFIGIAIGLLILLSTAAFILESLPEMRSRPTTCDPEAPTVQDCEPVPFPIFDHIHVLCVTFFTVEYLGRALTVHAMAPEVAGIQCPRNTPGNKKTWIYLTMPVNIIDFLAIFPFYLTSVMPQGRRFGILRMFRLARVFRVFRMWRYSTSMVMLFEVLEAAAPAGFILVFFSSLVIVVFGSLIYFAEGTTFTVGPEATALGYPLGVYTRPTMDMRRLEPTPYRSVPDSFWWVIATITTVGGNFNPTTTVGKLVGLLTMYVGIMLVSMPIAIIGKEFNLYYDKAFRDATAGAGTSPWHYGLPGIAPTSVVPHSPMRVTSGEYGSSVAADIAASPRNSFDAADEEQRDKKIAKVSQKVGKIEKQMAAQQQQLEELRCQNERILAILNEMNV